VGSQLILKVVSSSAGEGPALAPDFDGGVILSVSEGPLYDAQILPCGSKLFSQQSIPDSGFVRAFYSRASL
jgi:hypothetical protein